MNFMFFFPSSVRFFCLAFLNFKTFSFVFFVWRFCFWFQLNSVKIKKNELWSLFNLKTWMDVYLVGYYHHHHHHYFVVVRLLYIQSTTYTHLTILDEHLFLTIFVCILIYPEELNCECMCVCVYKIDNNFIFNWIFWKNFPNFLSLLFSWKKNWNRNTKTVLIHNECAFLCLENRFFCSKKFFCLFFKGFFFGSRCSFSSIIVLSFWFFTTTTMMMMIMIWFNFSSFYFRFVCFYWKISCQKS